MKDKSLKSRLEITIISSKILANEKCSVPSSRAPDKGGY